MPGWVLRQFWLRKKGEDRNNTKKLMAQSGSWCKVDSCDVHLNICDIFLNEKVCHSIEKKGVEEKARTFTDIVQDFKFSKGTHVDLRSQSDPPEGSEPRHLSGRFFLRTPTEINVWNEFEWSEHRDDTCDLVSYCLERHKNGRTDACHI